MKFAAFFGVVLCAFLVFAGTNAVPVLDVLEENNLADFVEEQDFFGEQPLELPQRQKRATCDLLSWAGVNHSACAAHCVLRGNRGGYCNGKAVCVCRN